MIENIFLLKFTRMNNQQEEQLARDECEPNLVQVAEWLSLRTHWPKISLVLYIILVFLGQKLMQNRRAYNLQKSLIVWNSLLAIFSIWGSYEAYLDYASAFNVGGFYRIVCICHGKPDYAYWIWLFTVSKLVELGDTAFLILRKKPVIFLHWYHHMTVLAFTWFASSYGTPMGRTFIMMNYSVHSLMYTYYAFQAGGLKAPKFISMLITVVQTTQMAVGVSVVLYAAYIKWTGQFCSVSNDVINSALVMYLSYLALFIHFFIQAYVKGTSIKSIVTKKVV